MSDRAPKKNKLVFKGDKEPKYISFSIDINVLFIKKRFYLFIRKKKRKHRPTEQEEREAAITRDQGKLVIVYIYIYMYTFTNSLHSLGTC